MSLNPLFPITGCTAVILAGGRSSRMGFDKKNLEIDGTFLINRVIANAQELFSEVLITASEKIEIRNKHIKVVIDSVKNCGPLSGIHSGLYNSSTENNFVIAADIPEISADLISEMYSYSDQYEIVIPRSKDLKPEPLFGFYKKSVLPVIEMNLNNGNRKVSDIYRSSNLKLVEMKQTGWYFNLNTPHDLSDYLSYLNRKQADSQA